MIAASIYNLRWTWSGRQVFWVDIESLLSTGIVAIVLIIEVIRSRSMFSIDEKYEEQVQQLEKTQIVPIQDTTNIT